MSGRRGLVALGARGAAVLTMLLVLLPDAGRGGAAVSVMASGPFAGHSLYAVAGTAGRAARNPSLDADERAELRRLAATPQAVWLSGGSPSAAASQVATVHRAAAGAVTTFVVYDVPHRDCGGQSAGGAPNAAAYRAYVGAIARVIGGGRTIVVLEPDSLAGIDCLTEPQQQGRYTLLHWAVRTLAARAGVLVYLDGGVRGWQGTTTMARRLSRAGIVDARGFAVNVSNNDPTPAELDYGRAVASRVGWKRFVVDTSRNGTNPRVAGWCNPAGARVGVPPGTSPGRPGVDALLWVKRPGESDGACGTSRAAAGVFDPRLALALLR